METNDSLNKDILSYKMWFITSALLLGYTYMHIKLTGIYIGVPLESWLNFSAPLPFGQRQLVPFLARSLRKIVSLQAYELFFIIELLAVILTFLVLRKLLQVEFNNKLAWLLSWLFFLLLPLCSVINYRLVVDGKAAIFYPYDTPSLFFMILGFYLCLKKQWIWLAICIFFATLNREGSILLVLLIPALHFRSRKNLFDLLIPLLSCLSAYFLARLWVYFLTSSLSGPYVQWYRCCNSSYTNFSSNLEWLSVGQNIVMFMFAFAGLPLFWFLFYDYIPLKYRLIRYIAFFYFLGLLGLGICAETRIFTEILGLIYLPVCIAISNWLEDKYIVEQQNNRFLYYLNRYIIFFLMIMVITTHHLIDSTIRKLVPVSTWVWAIP